MNQQTQRIDLFIGGAEKAGTTSIKAYLGQHPQIATHTQREFPYFVQADEPGAMDYAPMWQSHFSAAAPGQKILAKSAGLIYFPEAAQKLMAMHPSAKVLFCLRNPVDRAYSAFWFARRRGWETLDDFEAAVHAGIDRFGDHWLARRGCNYIQRGLYAKALDALDGIIPADQTRVVLLDDLKQDAPGLICDLYKWCGVDAGFKPDLTRRQNEAGAARNQTLARALSAPSLKRSVRRLLPRAITRRLRQGLNEWNTESFTPPPMPDDLRDRLAPLFADDIERLSERLGRRVAW